MSTGFDMPRKPRFGIHAGDIDRKVIPQMGLDHGQLQLMCLPRRDSLCHRARTVGVIFDFRVERLFAGVFQVQYQVTRVLAGALFVGDLHVQWRCIAAASKGTEKAIGPVDVYFVLCIFE